MFSCTIIGDRELIARLESMPRTVRATIHYKLEYLAEKLAQKIKREKLSGQVLKERSGKLKRSIDFAVSSKGEEAIAIVFSKGDLKYKAIHEYGGKTKPHLIEARKAKALFFEFQGKQRFFKKVYHPGSVMPERSYMRSSLREMRAEIITEIQQAALDGLEK